MLNPSIRRLHPPPPVTITSLCALFWTHTPVTVTHMLSCELPSSSYFWAHHRWNVIVSLNSLWQSFICPLLIWSSARTQRWITALNWSSQCVISRRFELVSSLWQRIQTGIQWVSFSRTKERRGEERSVHESSQQGFAEIVTPAGPEIVSESYSVCYLQLEGLSCCLSVHVSNLGFISTSVSHRRQCDLTGSERLAVSKVRMKCWKNGALARHTLWTDDDDDAALMA